MWLGCEVKSVGRGQGVWVVTVREGNGRERRGTTNRVRVSGKSLVNSKWRVYSKEVGCK